MEDLRFCNEFMTKQQHSQTPQKHDDSMQDDDFCLKYSGDEGIFETTFYLIFFFFFHSIWFFIWVFISFCYFCKSI